MPNKDLTELVVVVDRSGSMANVAKDMSGGLQTFLEEQRKLPGKCQLTLVQFDNEVETIHENTPLMNVGVYQLESRGSTALLDAVGNTIDRVGSRLAKTAESARPGKVLFMIITDGEENASKRFTKAQIKAKIEHQESVYNWDFSYLGANVDAFSEAGSVGILLTKSISYQSTPTGVHDMFAEASSYAGTLRNTNYSAAEMRSVGFSDEARTKLSE